MTRQEQRMFLSETIEELSDPAKGSDKDQGSDTDVAQIRPTQKHVGKKGTSLNPQLLLLMHS